MGVVFLADQIQPVRRRVAIKLIKSGLDVRSVALRFDQERNALALMEHPHIAKILDAGVVDLMTGEEFGTESSGGDDFRRAVPFFAMEYIQGTPITDYCDQNRLSPTERLELLVPVCQAVQHAHQKGIIHRDLKPSNILVETIDDQPIAKVIDFGVAKATGIQLTEHSMHTSLGSIVGTLEYMSPEQARLSNDIDTRTDVYALGVVLYELLAGSVPHSRDELQQAGLEEMLRIIKEDDPLAPSSKLSNSGSLPNIASQRDVVPSRLIRLVRGDLDWIVLKALDKDRNRRYESVSGLAADVQRFLDEEPVLARPPSTMYRLQKAYRRHRAAFLAAGLAITLLLLGILGTSTGFVAASKNAQTANAEAQRAASAEQQARDALIEVKQQRDEAKTQKQISEAVTNFLLSDLLQQASVKSQADRLLELKNITTAEHALKKNPTILELVDRASEELKVSRIEKKFPGQPMVQAALLSNLGYVYISTGEFEKAFQLLRRARGIYESEKGTDDPTTLDCMIHLGTTLRGTGRYDEFLELTLDLLERLKETYGDESPRTLYAMSRLANAYASAKQSDKSIATAKAAVELCDQIEFDDSVDRETLKSNLEFALGSAYVFARQPAKAVGIFERVYQDRLQSLAADHPSTLDCGTWLASVYVRLNQSEKAKPLFESMVPRIQELYGPNHPKTMASRESLAACYHRLGNPQLAIEIYEDSLQRRIRRQGPVALDTLRATANLGINYYESGRFDDAIAKCSQVLELGQNESAVQWAIGPLARALEGKGEAEEAERICREHLEHVQQQFADSPGPKRAALFSLALNLLHQQKYAAAELVLRELLPMNEKHAPDNWNSFNARSLLGSTLLAQDKLDGAEPLLLEGFMGMKQRQAKIPFAVKFHLRDAAERLVRLSEARGDHKNARRWQAELAAAETGNAE